MSLCSIGFLGGLCLLVVVFQLCAFKKQRRLLLAAVNVAFVVLQMPNVLQMENVRSWIGLACFLGGTYGFLLLVKARPSFYLMMILILATLIVYVLLKGYLQPELMLVLHLLEMAGLSLTWPSNWRAVEVIGLSYMLFKFIDALVHQWEGSLEPCGFVSYANYQLAFFTLLAGPIQRYNHFYRSWADMDSAAVPERDTLLAWSRLLTGMLKMGAIAPFIDSFFLMKSVAGVGAADVLGRFMVQFYAYPFFLYFNFSGYTDVAIGCGRLLGFQVPENFNRPFAARNLLEFWSRWHMSLTLWVRDYVFNPSYKWAAQSAETWAKPLGYLLLCLSLCVVGLWHGFTKSFAIFGLLNGLGVALNQAYADALRAGLSRPALRSYQQNRLIRAAAVASTFHFVCFSFLFFAFTFQDAVGLLQAVGSRLAGPWQLPDVSFLHRSEVLAAVGLGVTWLVLTKAAASEPARQRLTHGLAWLYAVAAVKTVLVAVLLFALWAFGQRDPDIVYQRF